MKKKHSIYSGLVFLLLTSCADLINPDKFIIEDASINKLLAGQTFTAAYFEIKNLSDNSLVITGINCEEVETALVHSVKMDKKGLMVMNQSEVVVKPHSSMLFEPGSSHIMLGGFSRILSSGDLLDCNLELKKNKTIPLSFIVN